MNVLVIFLFTGEGRSSHLRGWKSNKTDMWFGASIAEAKYNAKYMMVDLIYYLLVFIYWLGLLLPFMAMQAYAL